MFDEKKIIAGLLKETELDTGVLEKIGFASRAFDIFRVASAPVTGKRKQKTLVKRLLCA